MGVCDNHDIWFDIVVDRIVCFQLDFVFRGRNETCDGKFMESLRIQFYKQRDVLWIRTGRSCYCFVLIWFHYDVLFTHTQTHTHTDDLSFLLRMLFVFTDVLYVCGFAFVMIGQFHQKRTHMTLGILSFTIQGLFHDVSRLEGFFIFVCRNIERDNHLCVPGLEIQIPE